MSAFTNQRILNRNAPCTCGCRGRDSWHATWFFRTIRDVRLLDDVEEVQGTTGGYRQAFAEGWAKFPWANRPVRVVSAFWPLDDGRNVPTGWVIDKADSSDAYNEQTAALSGN